MQINYEEGRKPLNSTLTKKYMDTFLNSAQVYLLNQKKTKDATTVTVWGAFQPSNVYWNELKLK